MIGDRAYSRDPQEVAAIGRAACEGLLAGGVLPVNKHLPGHGRAKADSQLELPRVDAERTTLEQVDFLPFARLADMPLAMTAHVVYSALDAERPATTSPHVIASVIRGQMGFDGLLMSDDLSMRALSGDFAQRTQSCFAAGCDIVLHCNGVLAEMEPVASACPPLGGEAARRAENALARLSIPAEADEGALRAEFAALMGLAVA